MKKVNCLTKALWHWDKYGGTIIYDMNHAKIIDSSRESHDWVPMHGDSDLTTHGFEFIKRIHSDFLNDDEIKILKRYFDEKTTQKDNTPVKNSNESPGTKD